MQNKQTNKQTNKQKTSLNGSFLFRKPPISKLNIAWVYGRRARTHTSHCHTACGWFLCHSNCGMGFKQSSLHRMEHQASTAQS